ncbi:MAG TPA: hypothetical protein VGZ29_00400 [Terriglobia bacterium]|nr:hypothetical protein [Terriglobia bacterium]
MRRSQGAGNRKPGGATGSAKEEVRRLLDAVPDDASYEDIQYHIYVRQNVARGLEEAAQGKVVGQEEIERWMSK